MTEMVAWLDQTQQGELHPLLDIGSSLRWQARHPGS
jgi:hypothetical protein